MSRPTESSVGGTVPARRRKSLRRLMNSPELSPTQRRAVVAVWLAGAAIAGAVAPLAAVRDGAGPGLVYVAVATALIVLAVHTARGRRWALRMSLVLLGLQLLGAIGSAWELEHGVAAAKAASLHRLGVDPTFGVALSLAYSAIAFTIFLWIWHSWSVRAGDICGHRARRGARG